LVSGGFVASKL